MPRLKQNCLMLGRLREIDNAAFAVSTYGDDCCFTSRYKRYCRYARFLRSNTAWICTRVMTLEIQATFRGGVLGHSSDVKPSNERLFASSAQRCSIFSTFARAVTVVEVVGVVYCSCTVCKCETEVSLSLWVKFGSDYRR